MNWEDYIQTNPEILNGKPSIKGTRLSVELILERLANGWTEEMIFESYPRLTKNAFRAVHAFALECIKDDTFYITSTLSKAS